MCVIIAAFQGSRIKDTLMRIGFLSPLAVALLAGLSFQAQASGDDSCYPDWRVSRDSLEGCSNLPFLSPGQ